MKTFKNTVTYAGQTIDTTLIVAKELDRGFDGKMKHEILIKASSGLTKTHQFETGNQMTQTEFNKEFDIQIKAALMDFKNQIDKGRDGSFVELLNGLGFVEEK